MGLLEYLNSDSMMMQAGLLGPGNYGQQLAAGQANIANKREKEQIAKVREMQMQEMQAQAQQRQAQLMAQQRKHAALPGLYQGQTQGTAPLAGSPELGILPSAGLLDVQKALAAGYSPAEIQALDGLRNTGKNKVARTVKGMQNGREVEMQKDDYGDTVGQAVEQYRAPIEMKQGDKTQLLDPYNRQPLASFAMGQSPDSVASNQTTMRSQNMTDSRARDFNVIQREAAGIKAAEKKQDIDKLKENQIASFDVMLGSLDRLANHKGLSRSVGAVGALPTMPGSESANFQAELNTFQSQAFLPMVAQLKGMGALSDAEGKKLTAAVGALDPKMGEKAFRESVARITSDMEAARQRMSGGPAPTKPTGKTIVKTGMYGGRKVVQYSDGSTDYAN